MKNTKLLCGPVGIPAFILESMNVESFSHRTKPYEEIQAYVEKMMKEVFGTENQILTITGSGSASMETSLVNCFSPGEEVVVPIIGNFSKQFASMAAIFGLKVVEVPFEYGESAKPEKVEDYISENTKGILVVHNESSTGAMNDLKAFGALARKKDILLIVDSVSGAGGLEIKMDEWGIDVIITASQKCLMCPPGLSFMALSDKAWKAVEASTAPSYYFDLKRFRDFNTKNQTPNTPAIYTLIAVKAAMEYFEKEGLSNIIARTKRCADLLRTGLKELGVPLFVAEDALPSDTLTTVCFPGKAQEVVKKLKEKGFIVAGGLAPMKEDTFRIGTMGYVFEEDIEGVLKAMKEVQDELS